MKVAVIGGGSTYTPELIGGFLNDLASFPLSELCLMDINADRLEIVGGFARRMVASVVILSGSPSAWTSARLCRVQLTSSLSCG